MPLLTTLQVRSIMRAHGVKGSSIYTNKSANHTGNIRRVKCYYFDNHPLLNALIEACGGENINITPGVHYIAAPAAAGLTVRCIIK
jgi:hypothetical protein